MRQPSGLLRLLFPSALRAKAAAVAAAARRRQRRRGPVVVLLEDVEGFDKQVGPCSAFRVRLAGRSAAAFFSYEPQIP